MKKHFEKHIQKFFSSNTNKIIILIIAICLILVGFSPTIYNAKTKYPTDNPDQSDDNPDNTNPEFKQTGYNYVTFHWSPRYPDPGETVTFYTSYYASQAHVTSLRWSFGDGSMGYGRMSSHTYQEEGRYRVMLSYTTYDSENGHDYGTSFNYVSVGQDPFPRITVTPKNPAPGEKVTLDASSSSDPDGQIAKYSWSFYNVDNPSNFTQIGTTKTIDYTWEKQGVYTVSLYIEDDKGNNNTIDDTVRVSILKLDGFPDRARELNFEIINQGKNQANNVEYTVEIKKYSLLGIITRALYEKTDAIDDIDGGSYEDIEIRNIRRAFCRIKLVVTAKADNSVEVSKSYYGFIFGKFIFLSENRISNTFRLSTLLGLILFLLFLFISISPMEV